MLSLIEFLEEIDRNDQKVVIPSEDVERLVERFGPRVRCIGHWNKTTDGSFEIPIANIATFPGGWAASPSARRSRN